MDADEHYIKQTWRNRCVIATGNGPMTLSLPVLGQADKKAIRDVRLSEHGNWRHLHWNSIESAYRSSPYFEYYADDLRPFFEKKYTFLLDFNEEIREKICELLEIDAQCRLSESYLSELALPDDWLDLRNSMHPKKEYPDTFIAKTYYQVFERRYGFQPNMSVLDLLCNMGPESILYL
jgi:hypothetical protein